MSEQPAPYPDYDAYRDDPADDTTGGDPGQLAGTETAPADEPDQEG